jgi:hypothetical protein
MRSALKVFSIKTNKLIELYNQMFTEGRTTYPVDGLIKQILDDIPKLKVQIGELIKKLKIELHSLSSGRSA